MTYLHIIFISNSSAHVAESTAQNRKVRNLPKNYDTPSRFAKTPLVDKSHSAML